MSNTPKIASESEIRALYRLTWSHLHANLPPTNNGILCLMSKKKLGKKKQNKRRQRRVIGRMATPIPGTKGYAIIKTTIPAFPEPDYQLIPFTTSLEDLKTDILNHIRTHHQDYKSWHVEIWDADNVPPGALPDGISFQTPWE